MNIERMLALADEIENPKIFTKESGIEFDMRDFCTGPGYYIGRVKELAKEWVAEGECGTACCIGGHANLMFGDPGESIYDDIAAAQLLGLTDDQLYYLFYNYDHYISPKGLRDITRKEAAEAIRRMVREEGQVAA